MKLSALALLLSLSFIQSYAFAEEAGNPTESHKGGDVVGVYPSGNLNPTRTGNALTVARMQMAGNETIPGSETESHGARGMILGVLFFASFVYGIHKFIGFKEAHPASV